MANRNSWDEAIRTFAIALFVYAILIRVVFLSVFVAAGAAMGTLLDIVLLPTPSWIGCLIGSLFGLLCGIVYIATSRR